MGDASAARLAVGVEPTWRRVLLTSRGREGGGLANGSEIAFSMLRAAELLFGMGILAERGNLEDDMVVVVSEIQASTGKQLESVHTRTITAAVA